MPDLFYYAAVLLTSCFIAAFFTSKLDKETTAEGFYPEAQADFIYKIGDSICLVLVADIIYINASYRRTLLNPYVFLTCGNQTTLFELIELIETEAYQGKHIDLYLDHKADFDHWAEVFKQERQKA